MSQLALLRDWSLIVGMGELQNEKNRGCKTFCAHDRVKLFVPSLLKSENFLRSPFKMPKTSR